MIQTLGDNSPLKKTDLQEEMPMFKVISNQCEIMPPWFESRALSVFSGQDYHTWWSMCLAVRLVLTQRHESSPLVGPCADIGGITRLAA